MLRNEKGFTFVQTLVSLGLLGILFVVGFKLFQNQTKLGTSSSFQFESIIVLDEVKSLLTDQQSCTATFKGLSAIYEEVSQIKRYNPVTQRAELEFGLLTGKGPVYGQKNVTIHKMTLLGENSGFNFERGHVLLKIVFKKFEEVGTEFIGTIPIRVDVDNIGKILRCETSPGLHQEKTRESDMNPWREKSFGANKVKAVEFQGSKLIIGDIPAKAKLNVEGGVSMLKESVPEKCEYSEKGLLIYSQKDRALFYCGPNNEPIKLHDNPDYITTQKLIRVKNNNLSIKRKVTKERYKVCRLSDMKGLRGKCTAQPTNPKEGKYLWELVAYYESGPEVSCEFLCGN
ncbi:MAG: hypothetical protein NXH75_06490 [Halobacteriovoraceae bacterium]|nr:hypothetical protein [Halobacteriovoraceae bacterium]